MCAAANRASLAEAMTGFGGGLVRRQHDLRAVYGGDH